jgi:taurine dioxygenase
MGERALPKSDSLSEEARAPSSREPLLVRPLSGSIGAEILGVDLSQDLDEATFAAVHRDFLDHLVVIFPGQTLTPEQQIRFARRFGPIMIDPFIKSMAGYPEILEVIKEKHERVAFGESWHSDSTYLEQPPLGSLLYSKEVPPFGGDTMFANQYLAYEALSPGLRGVVDGLTGLHSPWSYEAARAGGGVYNEQRTMKLRNDEVMQEAMKIVTEHPVVRTHPETGRKALYVNSTYTQSFKDWTREESRPLLEHLFRHSARPEFTCRYRWSPGALALWDNRCAMHHPVNDYHGSRRVMHRVTVVGDRPV